MNAENSSSPLPTGHDIRIPWHMKLPEPLERDFAVYFRNSVLRVAPLALGLIAALLILAMLTEYFINPAFLQESWRTHLFTLMVTVGALTLTRSPQWQRWLHVATLALAITIAFSGNYLALKLETDFVYGLYLQTPIAILMICVLLRVPFLLALFGSVIMIGGQALTIAINPLITANDVAVILLLTLACASMSLIGQYVYERLLRRHFLSEHVLSQHRNELHSANVLLESQATVDGLTGCINRRGLEGRLNNAFHDMQRQLAGAPRRLSLMLFDIDFFKQYNDTYGHPAGDECLKKIASVPMTMTQNDMDFVARYGGEEFIVTLVDCSLNDALVFAERMRNRVEQLGLQHSGSRISQVVTISIGVTCTDNGAENGATLIKEADDALYEAKGSGRNCVAYKNAEGDVRLLD